MGIFFLAYRLSPAGFDCVGGGHYIFASMKKIRSLSFIFRKSLVKSLVKSLATSLGNPLVALLALSINFGLPPQALASITPEQEAKAVSEIVETLKPRLTVLDRESLTYHYSITEVEPQIHSEDEIRDWAGSLGEQFYNTDLVTSDMQGAGFYLATDPRITRTYGGDKPLLFVVPLRKGAIILDLIRQDKNTIEDRERLKKLGSDLGCKPHFSSGFSQLSDVTSSFRNATDPSCREIIVTAYRQLGVQAILYGYNASVYRSGCRFRNDAFNLIDGAAIAASGSALFWNQGSFASRFLTRMVSSAFIDARDEFFNRYLNDLQPINALPNSLDGLQYFERAARSFRGRTALRCGPEWSVEKGGFQTGDVVATLKRSFTDYDVQEVILEWKHAYEKKAQLRSFDALEVQRIRAIEKAIYLQTGLPQDFSRFDDWQKAIALSAGSGTDAERDAAIGKLFGESVPQADDAKIFDRAEVLLAKFYDPKHLQPGLFGALMKDVGYGPVLLMIKTNQILGYFGAAPFVATPLLTDPVDDGVDAIAKNKAEFVRILRECTVMMQDEEISMDQLNASDCAVIKPR